MSKFKYHKDGTLPQNGEVFVFGSNLAGRHGAGAARVALEKFGAVYGNGVGFCKQSYAIPTKDEHIETLPVGIITDYIDDFIAATHEYPNMQFFVTGIGCGLAGFKHKQIAPLFRDCNNNCSFPEEWREYLECSV